jgi:hypothetical protein
MVGVGLVVDYGLFLAATRDPVLEATQAADDTPVQSPAASNQPVNNAAS